MKTLDFRKICPFGTIFACIFLVFVTFSYANALLICESQALDYRSVHTAQILYIVSNPFYVSLHLSPAYTHKPDRSREHGPQKAEEVE